MVAWIIHLFRLLIALASADRSLVLENLALRQQFAVYRRARPKPAMRWSDRLFWLGLRWAWPDWKSALGVVRPATVLARHRRGFAWYWTRQFSADAAVAHATRSELAHLPREPPRLGRRGRLLRGAHAHLPDPVRLRRLRPRRRRILHLNVTAHPTSAWTRQQLREAFTDDAAASKVASWRRTRRGLLDYLRPLRASCANGRWLLPGALLHRRGTHSRAPLLCGRIHRLAGLGLLASAEREPGRYPLRHVARRAPL